MFHIIQHQTYTIIIFSADIWLYIYYAYMYKICIHIYLLYIYTHTYVRTENNNGICLMLNHTKHDYIQYSTIELESNGMQSGF